MKCIVLLVGNISGREEPICSGYCSAKIYKNNCY